MKKKIKTASDSDSRLAPSASRLPSIRITCTAAGTVALEELRPLQGELKTLSDENYQKLKASILEHGFSFPFFVWKNKGKLFVLDGHQRDKVLPRMRAEGYKIPPLPVAYIEAASEKEARKKILVLTSEYGHMTDESLQKFLEESDLTLADLTGTVALPEVDIEALIKSMGNGEPSGSDQSAMIDETWAILIECAGEKEQAKLLELLLKQGLKCRALVS